MLTFSGIQTTYRLNGFLRYFAELIALPCLVDLDKVFGNSSETMTQQIHEGKRIVFEIADIDDGKKRYSKIHSIFRFSK